MAEESGINYDYEILNNRLNDIKIIYWNILN